MRDRVSCRLGIVALLAGLAALAAPAGAVAQEPRVSLPDIEHEVMCPTCGFSLALSESAQADLIRDQIRGLIAEGLTEQQIKDELVAEYGPEVLAVPDTEGFDLLAWVVPGLALLAGAAGLAVAARRLRARGRTVAPTTPDAADPGDARRLEADLENYRL